MGIVQALLAVAVLRYGVGIEIARLPELVVAAVLAVLAAVAVTQALVVLFGMRGWFLALVLVVLQLSSAGAWFPIETAPAFFQALHPLLPMSHAIDAFRTLVAGGGGSLVPAGLVTAAWTAAALAVTFTAARLRADRSTGEVLPVPA
jgi:putative membrane protein